MLYSYTLYCTTFVSNTLHIESYTNKFHTMGNNSKGFLVKAEHVLGSFDNLRGILVCCFTGLSGCDDGTVDHVNLSPVKHTTACSTYCYTSSLRNKGWIVIESRKIFSMICER